ncbi:MAG: glycosyltransferase family 2 protein, partial [Steroidobacter sp.]
MTVDADTLLQPDAIAATRKAFAYDKAMVAAGGILKPLCRGSVSAGFFQWFQHYEYIRSFIARAAWMRTNALLLVSGALACFRRNALLQVGGFDPDCLVEDYELIHRLHRWAHDHQLHWTVRILGTVRGVTDAPATLPAFLRQRRRWFAGFLQTQYWYREMIGNAHYGTVGRVMLPVKAVDTLQPIYGLTAFALLLLFLLKGQFTIAYPVFIIISLKIVIDLCFHLWSVKTYYQWTGARMTHRELGIALLAAL